VPLDASRAGCDTHRCLSPAASTAAGSRPLGVFIADDSAVIRERLAELLGGLGNVVVVGQAADVSSATAGIRNTHPDVAIVDIRMPGGSGIDVLRDVKGTKPATPAVIMYTNYGLPQYRKACSESGADFFFDKATDGARLADTIRMLAARR
jgi:DNA-binding NarL/FixJ family response regulator